MGSTSTIRGSKKALSRAAIAKIATESANKAAKKTATKVAKAESTRIAAKVGAQAALNPDYDTEETESDFENEEDEGLFSSLMSGESEEDDTDEDDGFDFTPSYRERQEESEDVDDLSSSVKNPDIFAYGSSLMKKGTPIRFQIKKNGQFLTTIRKPYSEDQLQKDHGEGHYTVILRNDSKGTFIKQQSFAIAAPPQAVIEEKEKAIVQKQEEKIDRMFETFSEMQQRMQTNQSQLVERLLAEQREREEKEEERRREERETSKEQEMQNQNLLATVLQTTLGKKDDGGSMTAILQMMQSQQSQTTQMIMEMNKNNMMMLQEMRKETQTMVERLSHLSENQARDFRDQIREMATSKKDAFDPLEMFKMLQDTRENGFNFGLKLQQMAKELASESEGAPAQPKGIVESLFDNLGKVAPLLVAAQGAGGMGGGQPALPAPQAAPRPQLVSAPAQPSYKKPVASTNPAVARPAAAPVQKPVQAVATPVTPKTASKVAPKAQKPVAKQATTQGNVATNSEADKIAQEAQLKEAIIQTCVPLIGTAIQSGKTAAALGDETVTILEQRGVSALTAVQLVSEQDILDVAFKRYNLPHVPELVAYLKDYHAYLRQKASP